MSVLPLKPRECIARGLLYRFGIVQIANVQEIVKRGFVAKVSQCQDDSEHQLLVVSVFLLRIRVEQPEKNRQGLGGVGSTHCAHTVNDRDQNVKVGLVVFIIALNLRFKAIQSEKIALEKEKAAQIEKQKSLIQSREAISQKSIAEQKI